MSTEAKREVWCTTTMLSILRKAVFAVLCMTVSLWRDTSSSSLEPYSATVTRATTAGGGCAGFECPYYGHCVLDANNQPKCVCKEACEKIYDPVCGCNNKTYANVCELEKEACTNKTNITVLHEGECVGGGCTGFECPYYGHCELDANNQPKCVCHPGCPKIYRPVCGSDNKTYPNVCVLESEACTNKTNITVLYEGECVGGGCIGFECPYYGHCVLDANNQPKCVCKEACEKIYDPVCGCNNKTYSNVCELESEACTNKTNITVLHEGECVGGGCIGFECPYYGHCVLDANNQPKCVCNRACPFIYDPVCGSDNKTYPNVCELEKEACTNKTNITVLHEGECVGGGSDGCDQVTCPPDKHCIVNKENVTECVCNEVCPFIYDPVCGSDGKTYSNECLLRVEACKTNTNITIVHKGSCNDSCTGIQCPYYGYCEVDADNHPKCVCPSVCPDIYVPVCGSDNKTYSNNCELEREACTTNTNITVLHSGRCDESTLTASTIRPTRSHGRTKKPK